MQCGDGPPVRDPVRAVPPGPAFRAIPKGRPTSAAQLPALRGVFILC
jgi:hypothetical protein